MKGIGDHTDHLGPPQSRRLQVDFNSSAGHGLVWVPTGTETYTVGEHLTVWDDDTDDYPATVVEVGADTMVVRFVP